MTLAALMLSLLLLPSPARELPLRTLDLTAVTGAGLDMETAEESPVRLIAGVDLAYGSLDLSLIADCGLPWEPSARLDADLSLLDRRIIRLGVSGRAWWRAYGSLAQEAGCGLGARMELGPPSFAFTAAGGLSALTTEYAAIGESLTDSVPWARMGVTFSPARAGRYELAVSSDSALALWLRTSFELSGSWTLASGARIEGLLAARYTDLFTLTAYLDGFEARALLFIPVRGRRG
jgi:hypothetical protein